MNPEPLPPTAMVRRVARLKNTPEEIRFLVLVLLAIVHASLPIGLMLAMLQWVPGVLERSGTVFLGTFGYAVLALIAMFTYLASIWIGAIHRIILPSITAWLATASYWIGAVGFLTATLMLRPIADAVGDISNGDGGYLLMFVGLWIATLGYIAKVAWDDARDRLVVAMQPHKKATSSPIPVAARNNDCPDAQ